MRNLVLALLALFLSAPALSATENDRADVPVPEVVPTVVAEAAPAADAAMQLEGVSVEERTAASEDAAAAQIGPRGSFWWVVGVIVVAGVILAVLT